MAGLLDALLSGIDSRKRVMRNNLVDLMTNPRDFLSRLNDQADNYNKAQEPTIRGGELFNRKLTQEEKQQRDTDLAMAMMPAGVGHIAYHGSPHKFDKFKTEAIGTGEGAQAYGHGLYFSETPDVAQAYANKLTQVDGRAVSDQLDSRVRYLNTLKQQAASGDTNAAKNVPVIEKSIAELTNHGSLYKTDIPDEALARMLDWDKPLSQQAPEVQGALKDSGIADIGNWLHSGLKGSEAYNRAKSGAPTKLPLRQIDDQIFAADRLKQAGIPGIRYLDGGSRGAGEGSSNFVMFDPEMIRILERNGQPTGQNPWQPGEWQMPNR